MGDQEIHIIISCIERLADAALNSGADRRSPAFENALIVLDELKYKAKRGRPPTGFDKTAYMKEYMRKRRALLHPKPNSVDQNNQPK